MTEAELLKAAKAGSDEAFGELIGRTKELCFRVASSLLKDEDDASDEVQNAFCRAYVNLHMFEEQSKFSTWLTRIVMNCCMTKIRSHKMKTVIFDASLEKRYALSCPIAPVVHLDSPERHLARKEVRELVRRELGRLPAILRQPLIYHYLEDLPLDQMARRLGISLSAAKSRLSRGHKYLRQRMTPFLTHREGRKVAA